MLKFFVCVLCFVSGVGWFMNLFKTMMILKTTPIFTDPYFIKVCMHIVGVFNPPFGVFTGYFL